MLQMHVTNFIEELERQGSVARNLVSFHFHLKVLNQNTKLNYFLF